MDRVRPKIINRNHHFCSSSQVNSLSFFGVYWIRYPTLDVFRRPLTPLTWISIVGYGVRLSFGPGSNM